MNQTLVNGFSVYNLSSESADTLHYLVADSIERADEFIFNHLMQSVNENLAVGDYRVHRVFESQLTKEDFLEKYSQNNRVALNELFMYPIAEHEFSLLTNKMKKGKITIEQLYDMQHREPKAKLTRLLL